MSSNHVQVGGIKDSLKSLIFVINMVSNLFMLLILLVPAEPFPFVFTLKTAVYSFLQKRFCCLYRRRTQGLVDKANHQDLIRGFSINCNVVLVMKETPGRAKKLNFTGVNLNLPLMGPSLCGYSFHSLEEKHKGLLHKTSLIVAISLGSILSDLTTVFGSIAQLHWSLLRVWWFSTARWYQSMFSNGSFDWVKAAMNLNLRYTFWVGTAFVVVTFMYITTTTLLPRPNCTLIRSKIMAVSASTLLALLKMLFGVLACVMAATLSYGFVMDYFSSCYSRDRWMQVVLPDFLIIISPVEAWYFYKESRWIMRVIFIVSATCFGSVTICGYILLQFFKLSPEQTLKDPFFFVLARPQNRDDDVMGASSIPRGFSVVTTRIIYASLGCLMLAFSVYAWITNGSPFRSQVFSPCMVTSLTDLYIEVVVYSVWIGYKESSWITAFFWILSIFCFGSIGLCGYIVRELFHLTPEQPVYLILFNTSNRDVMLSDPLLLKNHHDHHHHGNIYNV